MSDIFDFLATDHLRGQTFFTQNRVLLLNHDIYRDDSGIMCKPHYQGFRKRPPTIYIMSGNDGRRKNVPASEPSNQSGFVYNLCLISHPSPSLGACGERRRLGHLGDESQGRWGRMMGFRNEQYIGIFYHIICHN